MDFKFARNYISKEQFDFILCADRGLKYAQSLGITPDIVIGDFDSLGDIALLKNANFEIIRLQCEKDASDTEEAISLATARGSGEIHLLGATGCRLDHSLANILLLKYFKDIPLFLVDAHNRMRLLSANQVCTIPQNEQYADFLSIIPISETLEGISITGCKYNLQEGFIRMGESLGISNEIVEEVAHISFKKGDALLIESKD